MTNAEHEKKGLRARRREAANEIEEFAQGEIRSRRGKINGWLLAVYLVLFLWALYYGFAYWGGLGPGLDY
jgi:hypothetical protein